MSDGSGLLQMVSEPDTRRCVSLLAIPQREVDTRWCASKDAGPRRGWIVMCASKDAGPRRGWIVMCASKDAGPRRGWIVMSHIDGEENKPPSIRVLKSSSSKRVLKP